MKGEWTEAHNAPWLHEALFLKSVLEAAGIEAVVPDEHTLGVQPLLVNAIGGVRVLVHAADLERAREVLESVARTDEPKNATALRELARHAASRSSAAFALFAGPNRDAIDEAVKTLALESRRELQRIDLAALVSEYAGETEKSLNRVFDDAERSGAVVVFDEADALFGRESAKDDARDGRMIVEFLARRKERFAGAIVLVVTDPAPEPEWTRKYFDYVLLFD